jgi:hypothetical protein
VIDFEIETVVLALLGLLSHRVPAAQVTGHVILKLLRVEASAILGSGAH